ncbi:MAG: ankyrin repeat domain-containing protein [Smithella sp.]
MPKSKLIKLFGFIALSFFILQLTGCTKTSLIASARYGDVVMMNKLLNEGARVDEPNEGVWSATPLFWALYECKFETAKILLAKGAKATAKDSYGYSALQVAAGCKNAETSVIEDLIQKGADVRHKSDKDGYTSLHDACMSGTPDVVKLLIDKGADVNAADKKGTTPLMLAVKSNSIPKVEILLERGADIHLLDKKKKTAKSYVKGLLKKDKNMMELLERAESSRPKAEGESH